MSEKQDPYIPEGYYELMADLKKLVNKKSKKKVKVKQPVKKRRRKKNHELL